MNTLKLKQAEANFLQRYPGGFMHPEMQVIGKKHKVEKMVAMTKDLFSKSKFKNSTAVAESMSKVISRASMVSIFEKPRFRDMVLTMSAKKLNILCGGLKQYLHGDQQKGFNAMLEVLASEKMAKWTLLTIIPNYYHCHDEVFIKPTTAKGIIHYFELEGLVYKSTPGWDFYQKYREAIMAMKAKVDSSLSPNNAAFCGFLMTTMHG